MMLCRTLYFRFFVMAVCLLLTASVSTAAENATSPSKRKKVEAKAQQTEKFALSKERVEKIYGIIAEYVRSKEKMDDPGVQKTILKDIEKEMPLSPEIPLVDVNLKSLNKLAAAEARETLPLSFSEIREKLQKNAAEKYPLAELKSKVTFASRRGPFLNTVSGILYRVTNSNVLVGDKTVSFIDMDAETRAKFDPQVNEDIRKKYVEDHLAGQRADLLRLQQQIFERMLQEQFAKNEENGYIYIEKKEIWTTAKAIARVEIEREADRFRKYAAAKAAREAKEAAERAKKEEEAAAKRKSEEPPAAVPVDGVPAETDAATPVDAFSADPADSSLPLDPSAAGNPISGLPDGSGTLPEDDQSGEFVAMSAEEISRKLSEIKVNESTYKELMERVNLKLQEINSAYFGIDADQGFKKALWGFTDREVHYALSREREALFKKHLVINRNDIEYPPNSRPQRVLLFYYRNALYKVGIFMGDLTQKEFDIYKNSLLNKYGRSTTQRSAPEKDIFTLIKTGKMLSTEVPIVISPNKSEDSSSDEANKSAADKAAADKGVAGKAAAKGKPKEPAIDPATVPYMIVWEGEISRGVLSFFYNSDKKIYEDVRFVKLYLPFKSLQRSRAFDSNAVTPANGSSAR